MAHTIAGFTLARVAGAASIAASIMMTCALATGCSPAGSDTLVPETTDELSWLQVASATWAQAGIAPPPVAEQGSANVHLVDDIDGVCGASVGAVTLACTHFDPLTIYLSRSIPEPLLARTVLHEMGHVIRGDGLHLTSAEGCPEHRRGPFVMCSATGVEAPTSSDVAFIGAGME